jgi:hypothetical protein
VPPLLPPHATAVVIAVAVAARISSRFGVFMSNTSP